ncbi:uncharacterized protein LOC131651336 [Vicia villosa]|uniref:uncharacterized protein LOC131651336 n=1 Tax=Vicia villosa TaxID=3911 RepID=UPI00273AB664|nr:uncharacterized protein LOC131651336 [Vicia villosa]
MVHPDVFPKYIVSLDTSRVVVKKVDVGNKFKNEQEFEFRDQILQWIRIKASKLGFGVVIGRFDNGLDRRGAFVTLTCKRSGKYKPHLRNFKGDETGSRKYLCKKLVDHPIACCLMPKEEECVSDMTLNLVQPKNILVTLKRKRPGNIAHIKQVYNRRYQSKLVIRGNTTEMQHLLKILDDNSYVSKYRMCEDGVTVRDIFWTLLDSIKLFNMFPIVLTIDSTYKTNKYKLLLLEIIGANSTEKTYFVGFAFLESEKKDNFN